MNEVVVLNRLGLLPLHKPLKTVWGGFAFMNVILSLL